MVLFLGELRRVAVTHVELWLAFSVVAVGGEESAIEQI